MLSGKQSASDIMMDIKKGNGKATYKTVSGGALNVMMKGVMLMDENGGMAKVTIADVNQSNGVIHVIVVLPK